MVAWGIGSLQILLGFCEVEFNLTRSGPPWDIISKFCLIGAQLDYV